MRTTVRTGIALSASSLALGGFALLASSAEASTAEAQSGAAASAAAIGPTCRYVVTPRRGLNVRKTPNGTIVGALPHGKIVYAKKCRNPRGWVKLRGGVKPAFIKKYVYRPYLKRR